MSDQNMLTPEMVKPVEVAMMYCLMELGWEGIERDDKSVFWIKPGEGACSTMYAFQKEYDKMKQEQYKKEEEEEKRKIDAGD